MAGCITGLLLRDAESFEGLPDPRMIIDGEDKFTLQSLKDTIYPVRNNAPLLCSGVGFYNNSGGV